jgi:hypothetical protein
MIMEWRDRAAEHSLAFGRHNIDVGSLRSWVMYMEMIWRIEGDGENQWYYLPDCVLVTMGQYSYLLLDWKSYMP